MSNDRLKRLDRLMIWQPLYSPGIYWLLGAGLIALIIAARSMAVSEKSRSVLILGLRGVVFAVLLVILLNPVDRRQTHLPPQPPTVALLVDCSESMALGRQEARLDTVKRTIAQASSQTSAQPPPRLEMYRFGRRLAKVAGIADLEATEDASRLKEALERLPSRLAGDDPQAVILFSDGAINDSEGLTALAAAFHEQQLPVHAFVPPEDPLRGDVAVTELAIPQAVRAGDDVTVRAVVHCRGFDGERVVVAVRPEGRPQATPLATLPMTLAEGPNPLELVLNVDQAQGPLAIDVPVLPGEALSINNHVPFQLAGRDGTLQVLYMEGTEGNEYRWLRDALEENPDIQCEPLVVNDQYASRPTLQRVDDPYRGFPSTRAELFEYDVVICSDIPQGAFTAEQIAWTVELVDKRGGGFAMVGGHTSFGSGGWDRTPWEQLIPFDMTGRRDYLGQSFSVEIPASAATHPIWQLLEDPGKNRDALRAMPQFGGTNLISRVKPAATLLGQTTSALPRVGVMPVFACEPFGRGRTFAMSTDTTYAWGRLFETQWGEGDNRYYRKFWRNVVRWLAENSYASQRQLVVKTDRVIYAPGEPIQLTVEAFDEQLRPTLEYELDARITAKATATAAGKETATAISSIRLQPVSGLSRYAGELAAELPAGQMDRSLPLQPARITVTAWKDKQQIATTDVDVQLLKQSDEWLHPQARPEILATLAEATGGLTLHSSNDVAELLSSFTPGPGEVLTHDRPKWDRPSLWGVLVLLLAAEWSLRRASRRHPLS